MTPEQKARVSIDALLVAAGWHVCNVANANIHAGDGAAKGLPASDKAVAHACWKLRAASNA